MVSKIKKTRMTAAQQDAFMARAAKRIHLSDADLAAFKEKYGEASLYLMQSAMLFKNINQNLDTKVRSSSGAIHQMLKQDLSAAQIAKITGLAEQDIASMLPAEKATSAQPAQTNTATQSTPEVSATQPKVPTKEQTWQALLTAQKEQSANCGPLLQSIFGKTAISTEEDMKLAKSSLDNFISTWSGKTQPTLNDYVSYLIKTVEQAKTAAKQQTTENKNDTKSTMERDALLSQNGRKSTTATISADALENATTAQNNLVAKVDASAKGTSAPVAYYNNSNYASNEEVFAKAEAQNRSNAIADASKQTSPVEEDIANNLSTQSKQDFIDAEYAKLVAGKSGKNQTCSLQELYNSGVITQDDVQAVLSEDPSMLSNLSAGSFNNKLSKAQASKCEKAGRCLQGTRKSLNKLGIHYIDMQYCEAVRDASVNQKTNAASQSLDAAKRYCAQKGEEYPFTDVQISLPANNKQASAFLKTNLPKGQLLVFDHRTAAEIAAVRKRNPNSSDLDGMQYGHICILNGSREFVSDIKENTIHTTRYGNLTVPLHYTTQSNEEFTKALLAQSYDRQENERMLAAANTQQNSTTLAAVATKQNERV
jgi:hypothetical protein